MAEVPVGTDELPPYLAEPHGPRHGPPDRRRGRGPGAGRPPARRAPRSCGLGSSGPRALRAAGTPAERLPIGQLGPRRSVVIDHAAPGHGAGRRRGPPVPTSGWRPEHARPHPREPPPGFPVPPGPGAAAGRFCLAGWRSASPPSPSGGAGAVGLRGESRRLVTCAPVAALWLAAPAPPPSRSSRPATPRWTSSSTVSDLAGDDKEPAPPTMTGQLRALVVYARPVRQPDTLYKGRDSDADAGRRGGDDSMPRSWLPAMSKAGGRPTTRTSPSSIRPSPVTPSSSAGPTRCVFVYPTWWMGLPAILEGMAGAGAGAGRRVPPRPGDEPRRVGPPLGASGRRHHDLRLVVAGRPPRARRRPADALPRCACCSVAAAGRRGSRCTRSTRPRRASGPSSSPGSSNGWPGCECGVRVLVVSAHPVPDSYVAAVRSAAVRGLATAGHDVDLLDLDAEGFQPLLTREEWEGHRWTGVETHRPTAARRSAAARRRRPRGRGCGPPTRSSSSTRRGGGPSRRS